MTIRTRRRLVLLGCLVPVAFVGCRNKEQAAPPVTTPAPPSLAPTTTTTTLPPPPPIWRAARWGMTKDELLAAFPGEAQRLAPPAEFGAPVGGSTDVGIPTYETDGMKFRVLFGFETGALDRVRLVAIKAAEATCTDVEAMLTEKHAAPADRSTAQTTVRTEQVLWKLPDQTIHLACTEARSLGYRTVTLDYAAPSLEVAAIR